VIVKFIDVFFHGVSISSTGNIYSHDFSINLCDVYATLVPKCDLNQ